MADARQARINARMQPWGDREIARFEFRVRLFQRRGLTEKQAWAWGDVLALRDQDLDDRRVCLECAHHIQGWKCRRGQPSLPAQLMRCPSFAFEKP